MVKRNKKAQIGGQVFIYLLGLIIIAGIIGYGYYAINSLRERAEQLSFVEFRNSLQNTVRNSDSFGNVKIKDFIVPNGVNEVCFVNIEFDGGESNICNGGNSDYNPIICDAWESKSNTNVFLEPAGLSMTVERISVDGNNNGREDSSEENCEGCHYLCVPTLSGRINIKFQGKGSHVFLSKV